MSTPAPATEWASAARLARRMGFGATGAEVDAIVKQGTAAYLATTLAADPIKDPGAISIPIPTFAPPAPAGKNADQQARKARRAALKTQLTELTAWWIRRMAAAQNPFGEKLTFLWHNHFATSATKVRQANWLLAQNQKMRSQGRGDFHTLAYSMLTDAATLYWLDGEANTAKAPNENLSREFMELFALGHGDGYTETDVREGARALTGFRIDNNGATSVDPDRHDNGSKTVLGVTGNLDAAGFCNAVLAAPHAASYVCGRMYGQLVSDNPPSASVLQMIAGAYGSGRNLTAMLTAMLGAGDFDAQINTKIVSPVEWMVGAVRALKTPLTQDATVKKLLGVLNTLGQVPFYPPNVGGWPSGQAWLSTSAAEIRLRAAATLVGKSDIDAVRSASAASRLDVVAHLLGVATWSNRSKLVLGENVANPVQLVTIALNTPEYLTN